MTGGPVETGSLLETTLLTLGSPSTLSGGYLYHQRVASLAPNCGARFRFVSFPDLPFPLPVAASRQVLAEVLDQRPDVVLVDSIAAAYATFLRSRIARRAPIAVMMHQPPGGMEHGWCTTAATRMLDRLLLARADHVFAASESLGEPLARSGVAAGAVTVVPPGCDTSSGGSDTSEAAGPSWAHLRRGRRAAVACVANWIPRKGIMELLDAFAMLPDDQAFLHLAGDADVEPAYGAAVRNRLAEPDLRERAEMHGRLSPAQVAALYAGVDFFALASVQEPYGTVYGEAMAAGLPVVGWRAGNLPNLASDGVEGLMAEPGEVKALSAAMSRLARDEVLRAEMGTAALRRADQFPTWQDTTCALVDGMRRLVAQRERSTLTG